MAETNFHSIERKWQEKWEKAKCFEVKEDSKKKKYYVLEQFPYPSGTGLHIGHAFIYTIGDIYTRFKRMNGFNVLYPMGYDSLGLPAENAAIKEKTHPKDYTDKAIKNFIRQQKALGLSYDWSRVFWTHDPKYYKWDQWIFLKMFEKGLVYQKKSPVNFCSKCNTVLANEQVHNGKCWRHEDTNVEMKHLNQWYFKITDYAEELANFESVKEWPDLIKKLQKNWIGKSYGTEIEFEIQFDKPKKIQVENVEHFRNNISIDSKLIINNKEFIIREIVKFRFDDGSYYMKLFLNDGYVLADDLGGNSFILVKKVKTNLDIKKNKIDFEGKKFDFIYNTHAIAEETYGEEIFPKRDSESFWDYSSKDGLYLSLGIIDKTKKRLDFAGEIIYSNNIQIIKENEKWQIFTTRPDTIYGVTFMVVSAQHPRLMELVTPENKKRVENFVKKLSSVSQEEIEQSDKEGVFTGSYAINPINNEKFPVYAGNFVVADYGCGMVMAVPSHDERDFQFAKKYKIPIKEVIRPVYGEIHDNEEFRKTISAVIHRKKDNKFLIMKWKNAKWLYFPVVGGIEDNEDLGKAAEREVLEESGYKTRFVKKLGGEIECHFYADHKKVWRHRLDQPVLMELIDEKPEKVSDGERERHEAIWLSSEEILRQMSHDYNNIGLLRYLGKESAYTGDGVLVNSGEFNGWSNREVMSEITKSLEKKKKGRAVVNYKLRDWLISRQRYWGTPIPIIHCEKCGAITVPEKDLPVELPYKVKFGKGNPLETAEDWVKTKCPKCGGKGKRETDTMDTFVNSSWYYLRYCDSKNDKKIFDTKKAEYWTPIDMYIGGKEHACMHDIYIRFYTKFLRDIGLIKINEPAVRLFVQGMVHGEDGNKMSKSLGNVVDPLDTIEKYSADALRLFLVSVASSDSDFNWSDKGIQGSFKFVVKLFDFIQKVKIGKSSKRIESKLNKAIRDMTLDIENFRYNLAIIKMRGLLDVFEGEKEISKKDLEGFLKLISVFCPHFAEELWWKLGKMASSSGKSDEKSRKAGSLSKDNEEKADKSSRGFISLSSWPVCDEKKIDENLEKQEQAVENLISDIRNILKILENREEKKSVIKIFVIPNEMKIYENAGKKIGQIFNMKTEILSITEAAKTGKAVKAKPGKPGLLLE